MNRSPFANFRKPHELLASASNMVSPPFSHSRARNRSSGSPSRESRPENIRADSAPEVFNSAERHPTTSLSRGSFSKSRSGTPPWESDISTSVPLLPPRGGVLGADWRLGEGPVEQGFASWFRNGKLGRWVYNTQTGWMVYAISLLVLYGVVSLMLLIMNRFILWSR